jgi:dihydroorotate dehydrogenase
MEELITGAVIFSVIYIFIINNKLGKHEEEIEDLDERLVKLEKDAVKVTFSEPPLFHPKPKTQTNYQNEHAIHPEVKTRKRKPKTVKEWEDEVDLGGHE